MNLAPVLERLYGLAKRGARRDLEGMREACAIDGDPQDRIATVHIAGTNGKGSVAASMESIARAAGLRTGLYTSPHLQRFAERVRLDGAPIDDALLARHLASVLDRHPSLTFFEVATLAAFHVFHEARVDLAVIEVGLGGRLDATNVIARPRATVVTTISYDHTEWLGDTIEAIAGEKAAICKAGVPVITGPLPRAAAQVVEARAQEVSAAPLWRVGQELRPTAHGEHLVVEGPVGRSIAVTPALRGAHQRDNAAIAIGMAWLLRSPPAGVPAISIEDVAIARGIASVRWPGRLETIEVGEGKLAGTYLLDGAHNEEGAYALGAALDQRQEPRALVFGAMGDKAWGTMVRELSRRFVSRVYVAPDAAGAGRAAAAPAALQAIDQGGAVSGSLAKGLARARADVGRAGLVVVAGSLYLVGEARSLLLGEERDPQVGM
ncbi:MAG: bifunctional folylpolyglutamate synthase/dihydrofolate synthase [Deltaproteobacteria bacterium]|nr:bifunctional folylpolyglutamate synthase/dihydrofolate synthase [Deltaproteobacteria bacterium]